MKILLAYVAVTNGPLTHDFAARFVATYSLFPPGIEHETVVVSNGGPLPYETASLFLPVDAKFYPRVNDKGYDISAYMDVAKEFPCDMLVCCGESTHFHCPGWMAHYCSAWMEHGRGFYGTLSSNLVRPHLNTTGFVVEPNLLLGYSRPRSREDRYEFEHGTRAFWQYVLSLGRPAKLVTWDGAWNVRDWRYPPNILWRGDQSNCLMWCGHTERYAKADAKTKAKWAYAADFGRL